MHVKPITFKGPLTRFIFRDITKEKTAALSKVKTILQKFDLTFMKIGENWTVVEDVSKILPAKYTEKTLEKTLKEARRAQFIENGSFKTISIKANDIYEAAEKLLEKTNGVIFMKNVGSITLK